MIAETAGENLGAITYYFGSKDTLIAVALADELRDWVQPTLDRLSESDDPILRLLSAVDSLNATFEQQRDRIPGLLEAFVHAARSSDTRDPIATIWNDVHTKLSAVITELHDRGAVPTWVQPASMAALIVAVAAGTVVSATITPVDGRHRQIAAQFTHLLINVSADG